MIATRLSGFVHCRGKSFARVAPRLAPITESLSGCLGNILVPLLSRSCGPAVTMRQAVGPGGCLDRPVTRGDCRTARTALARPPAPPGASAGVIQVAHVKVRDRVLARAQNHIHRTSYPQKCGRNG